MAKSASQLLAEIEVVLDRLSLAASGLTYRVLRFIQMDARKNGLRQDGWTFSEALLREIAGRDSEKLPRLLQQLSKHSVAIAEPRPGGEYRFPKLDRVVVRRASVAQAKERCVTAKPAPKGLRNPRQGITSTKGNPLVIPAPASPSSSPPTTPSYSSLFTPFDPSDRAGAAALASAPAPRAARRRAVGGDPAAGGGSVFVEFRDWWVREAWPRHHHGEVYPFDAPDGVALAAILKHPGLKTRDASGEIAHDASGKAFPDVAKAKALAELFLAHSETNYPGHTLMQFRKALVHLISKLAAKAKGFEHANTNRPKPTAADRGEYASDLPVQVRKL